MRRMVGVGVAVLALAVSGCTGGGNDQGGGDAPPPVAVAETLTSAEYVRQQIEDRLGSGWGGKDWQSASEERIDDLCLEVRDGFSKAERQDERWSKQDPDLAIFRDLFVSNLAESFGLDPVISGEGFHQAETLVQICFEAESV